MMMASRRAKTPHASAHSASALYDLFRDQHVRLLLVSCLVLQISQQLCGINAVFYYSTMFFEGLISNPLTGTTLVAVVNVVATYVALKLMDTCGRRTLVLWSASGMLASCVLVTLALYEYVPNYIALFGVMLFVFFFEIGLGPIPWLIVAEMFDQKYVATAMSVSCQVNWGCNFLVGIGFPFINAWLGKVGTAFFSSTQPTHSTAFEPPPFSSNQPNPLHPPTYYTPPPPPRPASFLLASSSSLRWRLPTSTYPKPWVVQCKKSSTWPPLKALPMRLVC